MSECAQRGFTLLEALLVLVIVGLLAALAWPSYQQHLLRSGRIEARQELLEVAITQERYHSRNGSYVTDATPLRAPETPGRRLVTRSGRYEIEVEACPERQLRDCFIVTARAQGRQSRDLCSEFSLQSDGARGAVGSDVETCWR